MFFKLKHYKEVQNTGNPQEHIINIEKCIQGHKTTRQSKEVKKTLGHLENSHSPEIIRDKCMKVRES